MRLLHSAPPYNLFGLEEQDYDTSRFAVLPVPYDSTTSYRGGAREGPRAIIEASRHIEFYNEDLDIDISEAGVYTMEELDPDMNSPEGMINRISKEVGIILDGGKIPVLLGGEHTIAIGAVKAISKKHKNFSVLHIDAHSDSRDEFMGTKYSHACVMARIREMCKSCFSIGLRSVTREDVEDHSKEILFMKDMIGMSTADIVKTILKNTEDNLYITLDLDALDTGEMPSVGTPEPGGIRYNEMKDILKGVISKRNIIGMDFNELSPIPGINAPNYLAAKLIYTAIGSVCKNKG
ncbi:MAG: agmatinase [Candidatus Marsarchaeota archaeon]|nr:agmatinase [Candidatus Marsarchaeota archaeon]